MRSIIYFSGVELVASLPVTLSMRSVIEPPVVPFKIGFSLALIGGVGKNSVELLFKA